MPFGPDIIPGHPGGPAAADGPGRGGAATRRYTRGMADLAGKHFVLGLSGGIACYKAAELCRALIKEGATVQVVMTEAATHFIGTATMQALSGQTVYTDQWDARVANNMAHIDLTRHADAILIVPCST